MMLSEAEGSWRRIADTLRRYGTMRISYVRYEKKDIADIISVQLFFPQGGGGQSGLLADWEGIDVFFLEKVRQRIAPPNGRHGQRTRRGSV